MLKKFFKTFCICLFVSVAAGAQPTIAAKAPIVENIPQPGDSVNFPPVDQMLGSMLMFGFRGTSLAPDDPFLALVRSGHAGNVILFDRDVTTGGERNIKSPEQVRTLVDSLRAAAPLPMFVGVDQEGGQVRRLKPAKGFMDLPSAQAMGQTNASATLEHAENLGRELKSLGINLDLAPVVDVATNPFNPSIGKLGRAFGTDPKTVIQHAYAFGQGLAKTGVIPTLKHFPGQGCAENDTHLVPSSVTQCWNADVDLLPYAEIFQAGWPGMVMVGHISQDNLDKDLPATLSWNIVTGLLRNGMGWQGVVISDDLQMKAVTEGRDMKETMLRAINAGVDILLYGNNLEWDDKLPDKVFHALRELLEEGKITEWRIKESWQRISALHKAYGE